ncbi:MAG: hypothetical protein M5U23_13745 [Acidimicrobiia bacterium]|nr:hypothetical protein [Acidimicrobiia bacterium]
MIPELFEPVVRAFDPDHVVAFEPWLAEMRDVGEEQQLVDDLRRQVDSLSLPDPDAEFERLLETCPPSWPQFRDQDAVNDSLQRSANPFDQSHGPPWVDSCAGSTSTPSWPLTTWSPFLESSDDLNSVVDPQSASSDQDLAALVVWGCGRLTKHLIENLERVGAQIVPLRMFGSETLDSLQLSCGVDSFRVRSFASVEAALGRSVAWGLPVTVGLLDGAVYQSRDTRPLQDEIVLVVGSELVDFLLWVGLSRLRTQVLYAPRRLLSRAVRRSGTDHLSGFARSLMLLLGKSRTQSVRLASASLDRRGLGHVKRQLKAAETVFVDRGSAVDSFTTDVGVEAIERLCSAPVVVYEKDPFATAKTVALDGDGMSHSALSVPVPTSSRSQNLGEKRWITETDVEGRHLPTSRRLAAGVFDSKLLGSEYVRMTRNGNLAVWNPTVFVPGGASIAHTWRAKFVSPPSSIAMLRVLLGDGFDVRLHDKGRYSSVVADRLSIRRLVTLLEDPDFGVLVGGLLDSDGRRSGRMVPLEAARASALSVVDELVSHDLAHIAHRAKCTTCSSLHVWRLSELMLNGVCGRCGAPMLLSQLSSDSFFTQQQLRFDEVLGLFLEHRSDAVITAFALATQETRHPEYIPEVEIPGRDDVEWSQLDVVAVGSGASIVGEAKTGAKFGSQRQRRIWKRTALSLAASLWSVRLKVVNAWTHLFDDRIRGELADDRIDVSFIEIPVWPWHQPYYSRSSCLRLSLTLDRTKSDPILLPWRTIMWEWSSGKSFGRLSRGIPERRWVKADPSLGESVHSADDR